MIVAIGSKSVDATSRPGRGRDNASTEKTPNTSAMQEPAPTTAASADAANTSFSRIRERSSNWFCAKVPPLIGGKKNPPRIPQGRTIRLKGEFRNFNGGSLEAR